MNRKTRAEMNRKAKTALAKTPTIREMRWKIVSVITLALLLTSMFATATSSQLIESEAKTLALNNAQLKDLNVQDVQEASSILSNPSDEWPMFHHDLEHSGYSTSEAPCLGTLAWMTSLEGYVFSSPAVADGKVYFGTFMYDEKVYCLDVSTGAEIWNYTLGDSTMSSPAVYEGKVYIGAYDGKIYCLNASTGQHIWNYTTGGVVYSSPAVENNKLYIGSSDSHVYCLNASTGKQIWNCTGLGISFSSPAVTANRVYICSTDHHIYCISATTGHWLWRQKISDDILESSPAIYGNRIYVGSSNGSFYCLDYGLGTVIWTSLLSGNIRSCPATADYRLYVGTGNNKVYCLDWNGAILWDYTTNSEVFSSPAVADGKVYFGCDDEWLLPRGRVYCLNATTGMHIWNYTTTGKIFSSPAIYDGRVYIGSYRGEVDGGLYAFVDKYAILAAPVRSGDPDYAKVFIYQTMLVLLEKGWTNDTIIFLTRDDVYKQAPSEPWIDGDATYANLEKAFDAIASGGTYQFTLTNGTLGPTQQFEASTIDDIVFILFDDHGGRRDDTHHDEADGKEGLLCSYEWSDRNWNSAYYWDDTNTANKLDSITCKYLVLVLNTCYSGEFKDDCQGSGRIVCTACADYEVGWWGNYAFHEGMTNSNADTNHNGRISIEEAHNYATSTTTTNQHPQISDGISGELEL